MNKEQTIKCYRWLKDDMTSKNGKMSWKLKEWNNQSGELILCENGLHAYTDALDSINNVFGNRWFIAEARGERLKDKNRICCSEMRVIKEVPDIVFKRFALFCAKDCLKNYEKQYPEDKRVSDCIKAVEDYLDGKIKIDELNAAESAAWSAAWSAARSAAWSAARSAAWSAESAAWSAESAAESAAWSAESAARSAAWSAESAARSAAWSAAESAAEKRQSKELIRLIRLEDKAK